MNPYVVRRTISTYVCQTRGQLRAQEPHLQPYPRLIQHNIYPPVQAFANGHSGGAVVATPNIHRTILYGAPTPAQAEVGRPFR